MVDRGPEKFGSRKPDETDGPINPGHNEKCDDSWKMASHVCAGDCTGVAASGRARIVGRTTNLCHTAPPIQSENAPT